MSTETIRTMLQQVAASDDHLFSWLTHRPLRVSHPAKGVHRFSFSAFGHEMQVEYVEGEDTYNVRVVGRPNSSDLGVQGDGLAASIGHWLRTIRSEQYAS